jgi:hypothetical protein
VWHRHSCRCLLLQRTRLHIGRSAFAIQGSAIAGTDGLQLPCCCFRFSFLPASAGFIEQVARDDWIAIMFAVPHCVSAFSKRTSRFSMGCVNNLGILRSGFTRLARSASGQDDRRYTYSSPISILASPGGNSKKSVPPPAVPRSPLPGARIPMTWDDSLEI